MLETRCGESKDRAQIERTLQFAYSWGKAELDLWMAEGGNTYVVRLIVPSKMIYNLTGNLSHDAARDEYSRLRRVLEEEGSKVLITGLTSARIIENHL